MTTRKILTDRGLKALVAAKPGERYVVYDTLVPPFGVRVSDKGNKIFIVYRRVTGKPRPVRLTLGAYPLLSLETARERAKAALEDFVAGRHPRKREEERKLKSLEAEANTFAAVAEEFIRRHVVKLRWGSSVISAIRNELIPRWGSKPIQDITRRDVVEMLEEIAEGRTKNKKKRNRVGGTYAARHAFAYTSKLFNWAIARDLYCLGLGPCAGVRVREIVGAARPRQRVLSDDELCAVWKAATEVGYPFGTLVQLLMLTGQRLNEVARMNWREIDFRKKLWSLPADRTKNDAVHEVPLSTQTAALLESLPRFERDYVLTTTFGERPISGFTKAKAQIDRAISRSRPDGNVKRSNDTLAEPWRFHDLRRTMRTHLSALPIQEIVRELVIGHRKPGLHKVYDQHAYRSEKRHAFQIWSDELYQIVENPR